MVEQVGSLAGFAAVVGLAILSALYFSQARDLRRLREWAGRAPERAAEGRPEAVVPGRVVATPQQRPQQPAPPAPVPATPTAAAPSNGEKAASTEDGEQAGQDGKQEEPAPAANGDAAPSVTAAGADKDDRQPGGGAGEDGGAAALKPGMPAPASAAAAAGAGAKSAAGPAAPGSAPPPAPASASAPAAAPGAAPAPGTGPDSGKRGPGETASAPAGAAPPTPGAAGASPQRPPGSVLPPRTGTLPPVRRLPSSNVGPAQTGVLGQAPKKRRNPVYVVLAIAGVLVLGAAAAIGVPALVNGDKRSSGSAKRAAKSSTAAEQAAPRVAPGKITVAVLNGTTIPGLAAQVGDRVDAEGFKLGTVSNASQTQGTRANSVVMYASGHRTDARRVARRLSIRNVTRIDPDTQQIAGDATVVVIVGDDKTQ